MRGESDVPELQNRLHAVLMAWIARGSVSSSTRSGRDMRHELFFIFCTHLTTYLT